MAELPQPLGLHDTPIFNGIELGNASFSAAGIRYPSDLSVESGNATVVLRDGGDGMMLLSEGKRFTLHARDLYLMADVCIDQIDSIRLLNPAPVGMTVVSDADGRLGWAWLESGQLRIDHDGDKGEVVATPRTPGDALVIRSVGMSHMAGMFIPRIDAMQGAADDYRAMLTQGKAPKSFNDGPWLVVNGKKWTGVAIDGNDIVAVSGHDERTDLNLRSLGGGRVLANGTEVGYRDRPQIEVNGTHEINLDDRGCHLLCVGDRCEILLRKHASMLMPLGSEVVAVVCDGASAVFNAEHHVNIVGCCVEGRSINLIPHSRLTLLKIRPDTWHATLV